jgi:hypothetical protein
MTNFEPAKRPNIKDII